MANYYFFFPEDTGLPYIQPVRARDIHDAWDIINFFFVRFVGYSFTITELVERDMYDRSLLLPVLTQDHVKEVTYERAT